MKKYTFIDNIWLLVDFGRYIFVKKLLCQGLKIEVIGDILLTENVINVVNFEGTFYSLLLWKRKDDNLLMRIL